MFKEINIQSYITGQQKGQYANLMSIQYCYKTLIWITIELCMNAIFINNILNFFKF